MADPESLVMVAAGPGRSGADTVFRILAAHPSTVVADVLNPGLVGATAQLLSHAPCDKEAWLPRRAAQVFTDFIRRLESGSANGSAAAIELFRAARATSVTIPVYGTLLLPAAIPEATWVAMIRRALVVSAGAQRRGQLVLKIGQYTAANLLSLVPPTGSLIFALRHPAETVIDLTESTVDGMRPAEAAHLVEVSLLHTKRIVALHSNVLVVHLESLAFDIDRVLTGLASTTGLKDTIDWRKTAHALAPTDVSPGPRWDHAAVVPARARLAALAEAWGYESPAAPLIQRGGPICAVDADF